MPALLERATADEVRNPDNRYYRAHGRFVRAWCCRDREVITDGPAGTGKSRMWLERGYQIAIKYPGSRGLIVRKTRASLTEAALVTFETKVLPPRTPWASNQGRDHRQAYHLPNGSEIVVGGLDKPERLFSTEYDWIYVQEATELSEDEWESLLRALRNNVVPYQQLVGDCNPAGGMHWIKRRANTGAITLVTTRHEDNPEYWDERANDWTENGRKYISILDALTGVRYKRLRLGLWVAAENVIYEDWDPAIHVIDPFAIPADWPRYRAVDFGMVNNFVCQWWALSPEDVLYLYREVVGVGRITKEWAHIICALTGSERISATVTDHDVEAVEDLRAHMGHVAEQCGDERFSYQVATTPATKDVNRGIDAVATRLHSTPEGGPRLYVFSDALVGRDEALDLRKAPIGWQEEIEEYVWAEKNTLAAGRMLVDDPRKAHDHSMDAGRYLVMYLDAGLDRVMAAAYDRQQERMWGSYAG